MPTDFFERQSTARRNTTWLVVLFCLAAIGIVTTTFFVTAAAIGGAQKYVHLEGGQSMAPADFPWQIPTGAGGAALALIAGGSLFKVAQLRHGGGTTLAERLGGRRAYPNSTDPTERRVLNVVEEMALASGVPVPPVFFMAEEQGINAFAAGYSPSDAVIGITKGCAEKLSRDELQGVVAHEFSHILNGDMRLNIRLIGVLHGILLLGLIGREVLYHAGRGSRYSSSKKDGSGIIIILAIGICLLLLGMLGSLFGNIIKAAVSRQREYLADASAVQFTRNPEGIAGALKRIGARLGGSRIKNSHAAEASHLYFAQGVWVAVSSVMATHPPLPKRILAIDPTWDGAFPEPLASEISQAVREGGAASFAGGATGISQENLPVESVQNAADQIGNPTENHRQYVSTLLAAMPATVVEMVHEPYAARAIIYATLLDRNATIRGNQLRALEKSATPDVYTLTQKLTPWIEQLDVRARLPLVDMALPALRAMSGSQYVVFTQCFDNLVLADKRIGLFEWTLHQILRRHLRPQFEKVKPTRVHYYGLQRLGQPVSVLLSTLAHAGQPMSHAQAAFAAAKKLLPETDIRLLATEECSLDNLHEAIGKLVHVSAKQRGRLVEACAACICADAEVKVEEAELLRAISDMLDCPMPPLLPGQPVQGT